MSEGVHGGEEPTGAIRDLHGSYMAANRTKADSQQLPNAKQVRNFHRFSYKTGISPEDRRLLLPVWAQAAVSREQDWAFSACKSASIQGQRCADL